nr:hypothetical protein [uncultured Marvinbryantia sp.]
MRIAQGVLQQIGKNAFQRVSVAEQPDLMLRERKIRCKLLSLELRIIRKAYFTKDPCSIHGFFFYGKIVRGDARKLVKLGDQRLQGF